MSNIFPDMTFETSETEGTGTYSLAGAPSGMRTFVTGAGTGKTVAYIARNADRSVWEINLGAVTDGSPDTLTRGTFIASSTGSAINWGAGTKYLYPFPVGAILGSLLEGNIGSTRPAWLEAGGKWIDNSSTPWTQNLYDGSDDNALWTFDPSTGDVVFNFQGAQTFEDDVTLKSTDAGATAGPTLTLDRDSASPAASDLLGNIDFKGRNSAGEETVYGRIEPAIQDPTDGSEDGSISIKTPVAGGALDHRLIIGAGVRIGTPDGGDPGAGNLNVSGEIQIDGVAIQTLKVRALFTPAGSVLDSFNVDSVTDNGIGDWTANFGTDFSSANYSVDVTPQNNDGNLGFTGNAVTLAAGSVRVNTRDAGGDLDDPSTAVSIIAFGDQ